MTTSFAPHFAPSPAPAFHAPPGVQPAGVRPVGYYYQQQQAPSYWYGR